MCEQMREAELIKTTNKDARNRCYTEMWQTTTTKAVHHRIIVFKRVQITKKICGAQREAKKIAALTAAVSKQ